MISVNVRPYQQSDADAIAGIINEDPYHFQQGITSQEFERGLDEPGERIRDNTFVVAVHEQIVGFISLCFSESVGHWTVYSYSGVAMNWRRRGIGTQMLRFILAHLKKMARHEGRTMVYVHRADSRVPGMKELALQHDMAVGYELLILRYTQLDLVAVSPAAGYSFHSPEITDAASWASIYNDAFGGRKTADQVIHEFTSPEYNPDLYIMASHSDGGPAAFINAKVVGETGKIPTLAVRTEHQGGGLGKALLAEALSRLRAAGAKEARIEQACNKNATKDVIGLVWMNQCVHLL
ncbi:GNAT family N-acetyltransferase [Paenibacillus spongiae]|uniref:GNAT family N-acetyltransferase n=1 Tax=Paenibacillus spongiae TaxID=2909671 RepID=A0ABY5S8N8_9BACL|nr:GNAT family N-acetyltransferase [Paenibacillus spongiae]UVI29088.1 GNAT family N-acetyltransferase [Paenibacillus spongiae]